MGEFNISSDVNFIANNNAIFKSFAHDHAEHHDKNDHEYLGVNTLKIIQCPDNRVELSFPNSLLQNVQALIIHNFYKIVLNFLK